MPIKYVGILNARRVVAMEGTYGDGAQSFKTEIAQVWSQYQRFKKTTFEFDSSNRLKLFYNHKGEIIIVLVCTEDVPLDECGNCCEKIEEMIINPITRNSGDTESLLIPL